MEKIKQIGQFNKEEKIKNGVFYTKKMTAKIVFDIIENVIQEEKINSFIIEPFIGNGDLISYFFKKFNLEGGEKWYENNFRLRWQYWENRCSF